MKRPPAYRIEITRPADAHLAGLTAHRRARVLGTLQAHLGHEPTKETRNRKQLRPNSLAPWELRLGEIRVYFDVEEEPERVVRIQAVGIKDRDRVLIGGEEVVIQ